MSDIDYADSTASAIALVRASLAGDREGFMAIGGSAEHLAHGLLPLAVLLAEERWGDQAYDELGAMLHRLAQR
ncbi:hypothetical protein [Streptomyces fungicidicus]